ncbi:MAG: exopolyphosphatase [Idiomarinaceae bacterium HL-53]|nr:MAG: exopolyphosphatase [Idiomarinaceae bacterium HL-53]CUS49298.1 exopolyphosphatase / guanosine-5'-triphosphate,3'-diphosphate pyrophosphatase [Idiomarinaceae bacterium HL-53]
MTENLPRLDDLPDEKTPQFAALDLGSNSFHLLTARVSHQSLQPLQKFKQKVELARGLKKNGKLSEQAIQRGLDALALCSQRLEGFAGDEVRVVATHTLREAINSEIFLARAATVFPFPIQIISGHEEARLIYQGVAQTTAANGQRLVIDIGGGSTEIISGHAFEPDLVASRSMGCVSFSERFFKDGRITEKRFDKAIVAARRELEPVARTLRKYLHDEVFGTSGTIKAIAQWVQQRDSSPADLIQRVQLDACRQELILAKDIQNFQAVGVDPDRVPVLPGGLAILIAIFDELGVKNLLAHDAALREGVLYELAERVLHKKDVRQRTIEGLASRYLVDKEQAHRVQQTSLDLYQQVAKAWQIHSKEYQLFLAWAALLHEVGLSVNSSGLQKHSGYILRHADMPGFNKEEQAFVATLAAQHRKKIRVEQIPELHLYEQQTLYRSIALLRLAVLFNTDRQPSQLLLKTNAQKDTLLLTLTPQGRQNPMLCLDLDNEIKQQAKLGVALRYE